MSNEMQVKARIRNLAANMNIPSYIVLQIYMMENLLKKIYTSPYHDNFVLKGGMLIASLLGVQNRTTMDMDFTVQHLSLSENIISEAFGNILTTGIPNEIKTVIESVKEIRFDDIYPGLRISFRSTFGSIKIPIKVDITTGDKITPSPLYYEYNYLDKAGKLPILAYNIETTLAEKLETIFRRNIANTRIRDFYDVYMLFEKFINSIDFETLTLALQNVFHQRGIHFDHFQINSILKDILNDQTMNLRWNLFTENYNFAAGIDFEKVIETIQLLQTKFHM